MEPLATNTRVFAALDKDDVSYCHWKSNLHLGLAMGGKADLDLLVSEHDREAFERIVAENRFIRLLTPRLRTLPAIEDWLGFDETTGHLSHLHVHYKLVLGEKRVKHHKLPIEEWLLEDCRRLDGVLVPAPEKEFFVLYVRAILKSDPRTAIRTMRGLREQAIPEDIIDEARWLLDSTTQIQLDEMPESAGLGFLAEGFAEFTSRVRRDDVSPAYIVREKRRLLRKLRSYQRYPTSIGAARKIWFRVRYSRPSRKFAEVPRKRLDHDGLYLAIVGADGSGKTTLTGDLTEWLGWKIETRRVFFGQPKRSLLLTAIRKARYAGAYVGRRWGHRGRTRAATELVVDGLKATEWLYVAGGRASREFLARRSRTAGHVVIAERYPVPELADAMEVPMEGPRIQGDSMISSRAAIWEGRLYDWIDAANPVFLLDVDIEVLQSRRPSDDPVRLSSKAAAVQRAIATGSYEQVVADRPYEDVLIDLKRRIWRAL